MPEAATSTAEKLDALRGQLRKAKLTAWLAPRQDEFQGEYVPAYAERLRWLTGFAGSWGTAIITMNSAAIFVDGRYTIQVKEQVDTKLVKPQHLIDAPPDKWIGQNLKKGDRLGFDPSLTTIVDARKLAEACKKVGAQFVAAKTNLIDAIWDDQPERPTAPIKVQPQQFAGVGTADKLKSIADDLARQGADAVLLAETSSVSWAFNLRGDDVPYTPVVAAYAIIRRKGKAELFIDAAKVPEEVRDHLAGHCIIRKRTELAKSLQALGAKSASVLLDQTSAPEFARTALGKARIIAGSDPCTMPKAQKNPTEQEGARSAQRRDGAAMVKFLHWLEREAPSGTLTEWDVAEELRKFRGESDVLMDLSFSTIAGAGPNAAIPHYHVEPQTARKLNLNEIFLIDSGGQYEDGTTDITRTTIIGQPTDEMKDRFTRVLKGMIQISMLRFPKGTTGAHLDAFARASLWKAGSDYDHGTGHGVGAYLSVHEGPARISKASHVELKPGMIMSNEPGYYKEGHYGIRIENLLLINKPSKIEGGEREMMGFETLTLCPIERRLIEARLLNREELDWLDQYHARVWRELRPMVDGPTANWLTKACAPIR